ncbi:hypothetical protein [Thaumasiovibrio subtropicus]|uniref:hypothetical protein n=1 Tax=Thaumasiovibrio subtropicus TaxID=1891207 RepID=UPI000B359686|nr:hypothetical protein [Thaumasiovibrio subtropicus]
MNAFEIANPDSAFGSFWFLAGIAAVGCAISYLAVRAIGDYRLEPVSPIKAVFISLTIPALMLSLGFNSYLDRFHMLTADAKGQVTLHLIYPPEAKQLSNTFRYSFRVERRGCEIVIHDGEARYHSIGALGKQRCDAVVDWLKQY